MSAKERDRLKVLHEVKKRDETMKYLEEGLRMRDPDMVNIQNDPAFDFLHSDPR